MGNGFFCKHRLYLAPQFFKKRAEPVVVERCFILPLADGKKNMGLAMVLIGIEFNTTFKLCNELLVLAKNLGKGFGVLRMQCKLYYPGNVFHVKQGEK